MKQLLLVLFLISSFILNAQTAAKVDSIVRFYPKTASSAVRLAERINKDFTTEFDKARAIYTWIALNIGYDDQLFYRITSDKTFEYTGDEKQIDNSLINQVLIKRKAVCDGYSRLFNRLATLCGLESEIISGSAKTSLNDIGKANLEENHAWNAVKIEGIWRLIDVTWGSGSMDQFGISKKEFTPFYFDTPSQLFFLNHYPKTGQWMNSTIDENAFRISPIYYLSNGNKDYIINEPKEGIVNINNVKKLKFSIANLKNEHNLSCIINEETFYIENQKEVGSNLEFEIDLTDKAEGSLTICIGMECWVKYKLIKDKQ